MELYIYKHKEVLHQELKRNSEKQFGLDYEEALEMSYENIQMVAKEAIKGVRVASLYKLK